MPGERTEAPTPRRLAEARSRGEVPHSPEIGAAAGLLAAFLVLQSSAGLIAGQLSELMQYAFRHLATADFTPERVHQLGVQVALVFLAVMAPLAVALPATGIAVKYLQSGLVFTAYPLRPDLGRLNPLAGLRRLLLSRRTLVELLKSALKLAVVSLIVWIVARQRVWDLLLLPGDPGAAAGRIVALLSEIGVKASLALAALAVADYAYQRWEYFQGLRMSREDIREEIKQSEGNPEVRARLRAFARKLLRARLRTAVPRADVVVTNPIHYAVALAYSPQEMRAPRVLAKGQGYLAQRIKEIAREHGVPLVENPPLARALYQSVEEGQEIPAELYEAVAEVLAYVYSLRRPRAFVAGV
jgi:flagellar biosynthetic protein FlhB